MTYGNFASAPHAESLNNDIGGPGVRLPHRLSVYSIILALPLATLLRLAKFLPSTVVWRRSPLRRHGLLEPDLERRLGIDEDRP